MFCTGHLPPNANEHTHLHTHTRVRMHTHTLMHTHALWRLHQRQGGLLTSRALSSALSTSQQPVCVCVFVSANAYLHLCVSVSGMLLCVYVCDRQSQIVKHSSSRTQDAENTTQMNPE